MIPFVGPSYTLTNRKASAQRSVNLYLTGLETPSKAPWILQSVPGLSLFSALGSPIRGAFTAANRAFFVAGSTLYEVTAGGTAISRGTLLTSTGPVDMAWGTFQLVVVDGPNGYVLTLADSSFGRITDPNWQGSNRVAYLDGFFIFVAPDTQEHYVSAIDNASSLDALDFASAESTPDNIVAQITDHMQVIFLGEVTTEFWSPQGGAYPFSRDSGSVIEIGCAACFSAQKIDNGVMFIGRDRLGAGIVYRLLGNQAQRVSTIAVEQALQSSTDISGAWAYVYQHNGQTFYCINAPGLASTWCYEVASGAWHERCDLVSGSFTAHRALCHTHAFNKHLVGDTSGNVYLMDDTVNTFNGDPLKRTRISPNDVTPMRDRKFYNEFSLDCTTGLAAQGQSPVVELSWSDNGGFTWSDPVQRSTGLVGEYLSRVIWQRLGFARDRVWRVDFSDDAPFAINEAEMR